MQKLGEMENNHIIGFIIGKTGYPNGVLLIVFFNKAGMVGGELMNRGQNGDS